MGKKALFVGLLIAWGGLFFPPEGLHAQRAARFHRRYTLPADRVFRLKLDVEVGRVYLTRAALEREVNVTIDYREDAFDVHVQSDFDRRNSRLEIEFEKRGWLGRDDDHPEAEVRIALPAGVETDLAARIKAGEVDFELGGLPLMRLALTVLAGDVRVTFDEPNPTHMRWLRINTKVGETEIGGLGNARFRRGEIDGGIGEMHIDFSGSYAERASVDIDLDIGETTILLPEEVGVRLAVSKFLFLSDVDVSRALFKSGRYYYSKNYEDTERKLHLKVSPGLGELRVAY